MAGRGGAARGGAGQSRAGCGSVAGWRRTGGGAQRGAARRGAAGRGEGRRGAAGRGGAQRGAAGRGRARRSAAGAAADTPRSARSRYLERTLERNRSAPSRASPLGLRVLDSKCAGCRGWESRCSELRVPALGQEMREWMRHLMRGEA